MDGYEATRVVFSRIQSLDPENGSKIMGLLLLQDYGEKEMIRLAFGPETLLHLVILKAKKDLGLVSASRAPWCDLPNQDELISPKNGGSVLNPSSLPFYANGRSSEHLMDGFRLQDHCFCLNESNPTSKLVGLGYDDADLGFGWRHSRFFSRGFCKNGCSCSFVHGGDSSAVDVGTVGSPGKIENSDTCHELVRSKTADQRPGLAQQVMDASCFPYSPKGMNLLLRQQQNEAQRAAALMMGEDLSKFSRFSAMASPAARQIYLTFPADSSFREEDVSNYFSTYGPVQDVRIPYQQKRMFGFVTFVYPDTVKMILAKGNPHFVCDSRVLVKPYKEKGKIPDKFRTRQLVECGSPNSLDSRGPFDLRFGARIFYNDRESLWRGNLEEQAIELQSQRLTNLQLLDAKKHYNHSRNLFDQSNVLSPHLEKHPSPLQALSVKGSLDQKESSGNNKNGTVNGNLPESSVEHNLPDSPFASPTDDFFIFEDAGDAGSNNASSSSSSSSSSDDKNNASGLDMGSFKFNCQTPRFSLGSRPGTELLEC